MRGVDPLTLLQSHRSERSYRTDPVDPATLDAVIEAGRRAPTWTNGHHVSVVVVRDAAKRAELARLTGKQGWVEQAPVFIAVLADFRKTEIAAERRGLKQAVQDDINALLIAGVDAGIALAHMMAAARSLGLGVCPIGGIRRQPAAVIDLLNLPPLTFPMVGLCLGHVDRPAALKPRMPMTAFRHDEAYQEAPLVPAIDAYDALLEEYWRQIGREDGLPWSENTARGYSRIFNDRIDPALKAQGFRY